MENVKILKGGKKGKFCACRSAKGGGRQGAGGVRPNPPPPVHPLIFEKPAVTTLKKCVDPSTVIKVRQIFFFFFLFFFLLT